MGKISRSIRKTHVLRTCPKHPDARVKNGSDHTAWALFRCGCEWEKGTFVRNRKA